MLSPFLFDKTAVVIMQIRLAPKHGKQRTKVKPPPPETKRVNYAKEGVDRHTECLLMLSNQNVEAGSTTAPTTQIPLDRKLDYSIGKNADNRILLESEVISRLHAAIRYDETTRRWMVTDNGSINGTAINGRWVGG